MMRRVVSVLLTLGLFLFPAQGALTVDGLDELWRETEKYGIRQETDFEVEWFALMERVPKILGDFLTAGLHTALKLLAVVLLCALGQGMSRAGQNGSDTAIRLAGALSITALTMTDVSSMIGLGWDTISKIDVLSAVLLPVMAVLSAVSGEVAAGTLRQGATMLFSKGLMTVMDGLLVPLVYAYVAVSCAQAVAANPGLDKLAQGIKSVVTGFLTALLVIFVGYLTAGGAIAGSVDISRIKAARMAISRAIPVVGSILADASEAVLVGAGVLRGTVGTAGLMVVLAICMTPFLHLAAQYMLYKGTAALCAAIAQPELAKLIDSIGSAFGLILGMTGAAALILLVSVVSGVLAVTG